ncbi:hypothetical protein ACIPYQ_39830 [Streptomyces sp. NPDC090045]|uniref:hypothetical protein n=1 Tax=Streptomyces sp. NPDC090045 TaxID=3365927 RepID=UPI00381BF73A
MKKITRWYTPADVDGYTKPFLSSEPPGAVVSVPLPGRGVVRLRLTETRLHGPYEGTYGAERERTDYL